MHTFIFSRNHIFVYIIIYLERSNFLLYQFLSKIYIIQLELSRTKCFTFYNLQNLLNNHEFLETSKKKKKLISFFSFIWKGLIFHLSIFTKNFYYPVGIEIPNNVPHFIHCIVDCKMLLVHK